MLVNKDLNILMRAGKIRGHNLREQNQSALIVAACMLAAGVLILIALFIRLACG